MAIISLRWEWICSDGPVIERDCTRRRDRFWVEQRFSAAVPDSLLSSASTAVVPTRPLRSALAPPTPEGQQSTKTLHTRCEELAAGDGFTIIPDVLLYRILKHQRAFPLLTFTRGRGRGLGSTASFAGVICNIDLPLTCTKLSSRAASSAFTASFTRDRATKFPKKVSRSVCSAAITQSRYFESSADSASCTDSPTPSRTASGAQR